MSNKIEWVAKNVKRGDLTRCALAYKYDPEYLGDIAKGRRNNTEMLENLIGFIKEMRQIERVDTVANELLNEVETSEA